MGPAYGVPTEGALEALALLSYTEGVPTDPVYSAKALHALVERGRELGGPIVFWHTGGLPALFSDEQRLMDWDAFPAKAIA
jgi:1-aminocyclopropane-1-carboxylate deaminase/D-cysteine desulfhydrase-like pyridoxal-dependent ACC family enzyme